MKIVLPIHHFLPTHSAGAEQYTARLAQNLRARGHNVEVIAIESTTHGGDGQIQVDSTPYHDIPVHRLHFNLDALPDRERNLFDNSYLGDWFSHYFERARPDLVHFQAGYLLGVAPLLAAHTSRIASLLTLHDYWFVCPRFTLLRGDGSLCTEIPQDPAACAWCNLLMQRRYQLLDRVTAGQVGRTVTRTDLLGQRALMTSRRQKLAAALKQVDAILSPSNFLADMVADVVDRRRIEVVRFGFEAPPRSPTASPAPASGLRIGFIGQVNEHKGVHLLVEAFRRLNASLPLTLDIHGNIPVDAYRQRLARLANADPRIHFHGRYENRRVADILASFTVCVAPSIWYENSPIAIQEAQVAQVPVITAALGGMQELVQDGVNGLHFAPRSAASLAAQLQRLVDDPALLARLQAGARSTRIRAVDDELDDLERIYRRVLASRAPMPALPGRA